jgi:oligopeptide transport system permease protein
MIALINRKLLSTALSLLTVVSLTFCLLKLIPGNPFQQEQSLPIEIYESLLTHYGLNESVSSQYFLYLKQLLTFNLGPSLIYQDRDVTQIIRESFPISAFLGIEALLIAIPFGMLLGILSAIRKNRFINGTVLLYSMIGISIPSFVLATILQYVLAIKLGWFPIARWGSFSQTVLPALTLATLPTAFIAKMTRTLLIEELKKSYIRTAYSKGLSQSIIIFRHSVRNIAAPLLSYLGPLAASVMTGSFIVEKIYSIPGLGYWFISSVSNRDFPLIMGITVFYCALLLFANLTVELLCIFIDPRLRKEARAGGL